MSNSKEARRSPPLKAPGMGKEHRTRNGVTKDVRTLAALFGCTEKTVRAMVARNCIPYRRLGGRIIFLESEITHYLNQLPGNSLKDSLHNLERRHGQ